MNSANPIGTNDGTLEAWRPMLELASREVFEIMLGCKLEVQTDQASLPCEFTAMVGLAGQLCGLLTLRCGSQSAALMASKMLGVEIKQADEQMWDAIGEVANMIAGNFKNKLAGMGDSCMLSVPTVITGSDYSCRSMADTAPLEVAFQFEGAPVIVALELHS